MRCEVIKCDACCKEHNTILIAPIRPIGWYALASIGDAFVGDLHFCSLHCLHEWVEKQMPVVEEVKPMSEMFPNAFRVIDPPVTLNETQVKNIVPDEYWRGL